jgi:ABC-type branched-subunit amino acid transport system ATPase component
LAETLLAVDGLSVTFGATKALDDVSLSVASGKLVGLIGANGAGKTTLLDAVTGFVPARGSVRFDGQELLGLPAHARSRLGLIRTWQQVQLFSDLTARENLQVAAAGRSSTWQLLRTWTWRSSRSRDEQAEEVLAALGIPAILDRNPSELPHGQRKLLGVARALITRPRLLLLDEPAAGLDSTESAAFGNALRRICDQGLTMMLIDHDMGLVLGVCDYVYVLDSGRLIAAGTPPEIRADAQVIGAYLGEPAQ